MRGDGGELCAEIVDFPSVVSVHCPQVVCANNFRTALVAIHLPYSWKLCGFKLS